MSPKPQVQVVGTTELAKPRALPVEMAEWLAAASKANAAVVYVSILGRWFACFFHFYFCSVDVDDDDDDGGDDDGEEDDDDEVWCVYFCIGILILEWLCGICNIPLCNDEISEL